METDELIFDFLGPDTIEMQKFIGDVWPEKIHARVLDLASGSGEHLFGFINKSIESVTVVDRSPESLQLLLNKHNNHGNMINTVCSDLNDWSCPQKFDIVHIGDNSIQMFPAYKNQFDIFRVIASSLSAEGVGMVNVTPVTEHQIMEYGGAPKVIKSLTIDGEAFEVYGEVKIDVFNQILMMYFTVYKNENETSRCTCRCRMLLKHEIEEMAKAAGLKIVQVKQQKLKRGNDSYYYLLQLNQ
ncbi:class I SAM-dependent methyltransferase [Paenibacillus polymyxa]|uniref:Class I SAM-dependent methyltransferase n=1 Tax=Paenibacillus polymyxa TaxID=1406 RepID=A0A8I1LX21_PAEPO|nr:MULTISPECIES: class I SAM-dependent methyltransferase [Paenibacillus]KAF6570278.1 class I SAM-dependent methyltransferase [Paenibacillus sp. EKM206P]KAF6585671.1 class I SAM-dependent methyltransferase [Paenibacillus sp. EKM205P]MBM0635457.1 class I SAM-dependent methyltransferase [Paenibacillus polymyxa]